MKKIILYLYCLISLITYKKNNLGYVCNIFNLRKRQLNDYNIITSNWKYIAQNQVLTENYIKKFILQMDWKYIAQNQVLTENYIKNY